MEAAFEAVGCVIMASGTGKRFGGNKLMAGFRDRPLICGILDATEGLFGKRVVVTRHESVAELCRSRGISVVLHDLPCRSDTVRLGLEAVGQVERCVFCTGDQPLLRRETLEALVLAGEGDPACIWRVCWEETPGSPVMFPGWALPELRSLPDGEGGSYVIKKYPERIRTVSVRDIWELKDVDSLQDLQRMSER